MPQSRFCASRHMVMLDRGPCQAMPNTPEALAREMIDSALTAAEWVVQDVPQVSLGVGRGVVRSGTH